MSKRDDGLDQPAGEVMMVCTRCGSTGQIIVKVAMKVEGQMIDGTEVRDCPDCNGQGYIWGQSKA